MAVSFNATKNNTTLKGFFKCEEKKEEIIEEKETAN